MTAQRRSPRHHLSRRVRPQRAAFTLIELMIVVTITGVLAAIAGPTFTGYIQKSRTSEAVTFLGVIKLRQESFRAEFGRYLGYGEVPGTPGNSDVAAITFIPSGTLANAQSVAFPTNNTWFNQLGAQPDGAVRFGYGWAAGLPGVGQTTNTAPLGLPGPDHWFIAQGVTDLDGDGNIVTFELSSHTRSVWVGVAGVDSPAGWD